MSQRNELTMPITMIDNMTALMTMRSALRTMDSHPIVFISVDFYLIDLNIRNV